MGPNYMGPNNMTESDERLGPLVSLGSHFFLATVTRGIEPDSDSVRVPVEIVLRKIKVGRAPCLALPGAPPVIPATAYIFLVIVSVRRRERHIGGLC